MLAALRAARHSNLCPTNACIDRAFLLRTCVLAGEQNCSFLRGSFEKEARRAVRISSDLLFACRSLPMQHQLFEFRRRTSVSRAECGAEMAVAGKAEVEAERGQVIDVRHSTPRISPTFLSLGPSLRLVARARFERTSSADHLLARQACPQSARCAFKWTLFLTLACLSTQTVWN